MKSETLPNLSNKAAGFALDTLRTHYLHQVEQYEGLASSARSQLERLEALLVDVPPTSVRSFDLGEIGIAKPKATSRRASKAVEPEDEDEEEEGGEGEADGPAAAVKVAPRVTKKVVKAAKTPKISKVSKVAKVAKPKAAITKTPAKPKRAEIISVAPPKGKATKVAVTAEAATKVRARNGKLTMKAPYGSLTMLDAIGSVLEANKGKPVSADSVVDILYGSLSSTQLKVAKDRVTKSLSKGKIEDRWDKVPDRMGVYTLSLGSMK